VDVDTGAQAAAQELAQTGRQLAGIGMDMLEKTKAAEMLAYETDGQIQVDTLSDTYLAQSLETGDPKARAELLEAAIGRMREYATTPKLKAYVARQEQLLRTKAMGMDVQQRIADSKVKLESSLNSLLPMETEYDRLGRPIGPDREAQYKDAIERGVSLGVLGQEQGVQMLQNYPIDSVLSRMERAAADDDPEGVLRASVGVDKKKMTNKQLKYHSDMVAASERSIAQAKKVNTTQTVNSVVFGMDENQAVNPLQKHALAEQYKKSLAESSVSSEEARVMIDRINRWKDGELAKSDPIVLSNLRSLVGQINESFGADDIAYASDMIDANMGSLAAKDIGDLRLSLTKQMDTATSKAIFDALLHVDDNRQYSELNMAALQWVRSQRDKGITVGPNEAFMHSRGLAATWRANTVAGRDKLIMGEPREKRAESKLPAPKTKEERDALDPGTNYIAPNGKMKTRP